MHVHQYLQMHIPGGIVAGVPAARLPTSTSPEVREMPQGHPRPPVRTGSPPCVQDPAPTGLPDPAWLGELPSAAAATGFQVASCPLDRGVTASGTARDFTRQILGSWGLRGLAEDAAVIVSELVTNALRHGARDRNGSTRDGSGHERVELI